ncbi:YHS domain-containing (seleno)protein [Fluviispira sanaruensis]|uniref:YHS domain protein n=1 Tax=Fluviispira sanaruensis TaxID=2493639 RepID=A0A4P2VYX4_FLUSA|nr:YHS domain-containing (seleno)protein [Fluviispira sanaruensis]BBH54142.1 YHS domain protein [Fluviispira sanaruensis]
MKIFIIIILSAFNSISYAESTANLEKNSAANLEESLTANIKDGVILKGYDPVSYFKGSKPIKGKPEIKVNINGITYLFSTSENKIEFLKNPKKYTPEYEGWCATAVADGYKFDIHPENYKITNDRLFLFYKGWRGNAKTDWLKDEPGQIKKADENWPKVRNEKE